MASRHESLYEEVCRHAVRTATLESIESVLGWDERTKLPPAGAEHRAEQITLLAGMIHRRWTDRAFVDQLFELGEGPLADPPDTDTAVNIRRLKRRVDRKIRLPDELVEELARTAVLGQQVWQRARREDDFGAFRPLLEKTVELKRQEAEAVGYDAYVYDALLDEYEPEAKTAEVAGVLAGLRTELVPLVAELHQSGRAPDRSILTRRFPVAAQEALGIEMARAIGFDFEQGRLDVTAHPFCADLGPRDCRITTRYDEHYLSGALFGILHETGHGLYDQGLPDEWFGLPLGWSVSLGIHESQSRMWENFVGRSRPFWEHFFPRAQEQFPDALGGVSLDEFHFAINDVRPSLIRVEADEATYNLHILVRFELEQALLDGDLAVADLPGAWNEKYRDYLGIEPKTDADGVLQDVHWSSGAIGYFPTYSLGNLYAAQLFATAEAESGGLDESIARGDFRPLREWLREKIHGQGQRYSAAELVRRVTGRPLEPGPLLTHLRAKLRPLYGLE
jgi:carboxypeptidase Taq